MVIGHTHRDEPEQWVTCRATGRPVLFTQPRAQIILRLMLFIFMEFRSQYRMRQILVLPQTYLTVLLQPYG